MISSTDVGVSCRLELFCQLGCVCDSVFGERVPRVHCGHPECMFDLSCRLKNGGSHIENLEDKTMSTRSKTGSRVTKLYDETEAHVESETDSHRYEGIVLGSALRVLGARGRSRGRPRLNRCPPLVVRGARGRPRLKRSFSSSFNGRIPTSYHGRPRARGRPRSSSVFVTDNESSNILDQFRFPVPPYEPFEDVMIRFLGLGQVSVPNVSRRESLHDFYPNFGHHWEKLRQSGIQIESVTEINFIEEESLKSRIAQMQIPRAQSFDFFGSKNVPVAVLYENDLHVTRVIFPVGLRYIYYEKTLIELPFVEDSEFWILQRASGVQTTYVNFKVEERYQRFSVSNEILRGLFISSARGHILKMGEVGTETSLRIIVSPTFLNYFFVGPFPFEGHNPHLSVPHEPVYEFFQDQGSAVKSF